MLQRPSPAQYALTFLFLVYASLPLSNANAAACTTQSQMEAAQRDALTNAARNIFGKVQSDDLQGLRENTLPAVAADFSGITKSVEYLKPLLQGATVTVDELYVLDASADSASGSRVDFYCGSPVVALNFTSLPPGTYALAILHATGVLQPQQVSFILSKGSDGRWMLAGFFDKPMIAAGHDGLWYWKSARNYAQSKMNWDAWFYYRMASDLLDPLSFLSSPNLEKLQHEEDGIRPSNLPGEKPMTLTGQSSIFQVTVVDNTTALGGLDLEVHYTPDPAQAAQLHDPPSARKQVMEVMTTLLVMHPELRDAFHGIWVYADQGSASLFSLELPMGQIVPGSPHAAAN